MSTWKSLILFRQDNSYILLYRVLQKLTRKIRLSEIENLKKRTLKKILNAKDSRVQVFHANKTQHSLKLKTQTCVCSC
jgi:hypothetical protein